MAWCDVLYFDYDKSLQAWLLYTCDGHCHKLRKGITAEQILGWNTELLRANKGCIVNAAHIDGIEYAPLHARYAPLACASPSRVPATTLSALATPNNFAYILFFCRLHTDIRICV